MDRDALAERIRDSLPDFESVLIGVLCLGGLLIFLDILGIDVIENIRNSQGGVVYFVYPVTIALLSYLIERFRDAFDEPHTADVPDPLGDRESESETEGDESEAEPAAEERTVEFARSRNDSSE
ncbi:hypothetical protein [Halococcus hamelinensis]|uniref:Uncharacterized protein n=1 Tax=Halococcus hamelinensis 100A6 TaxID=1132509 RepID=M0M9L5_9EURY|nr:hypothetical protein [Halococcus hamelinensis]EMA42008.1 hypothetical protein C447_00420 [Halococcus hamelinensis 100A6]